MIERRKDYPELLTTLKNLSSKVDEINELLIGNGEIGLKERIRELEKFVLELRDYHKQIRNVIIGATGTIVTSIFIAIIIYVIIPR